MLDDQRGRAVPLVPSSPPTPFVSAIWVGKPVDHIQLGTRELQLSWRPRGDRLFALTSGIARKEDMKEIVANNLRDAYRGEFHLRAAWSGIVLGRFLTANDVLVWDPTQRCLPLPSGHTRWERDLELLMAQEHAKLQLSVLTAFARDAGIGHAPDLRRWRADFDNLCRPKV